MSRFGRHIRNFHSDKAYGLTLLSSLSIDVMWQKKKKKKWTKSQHLKLPIKQSDCFVFKNDFFSPKGETHLQYSPTVSSLSKSN